MHFIFFMMIITGQFLTKAMFCNLIGVCELWRPRECNAHIALHVSASDFQVARTSAP